MLPVRFATRRCGHPVPATGTFSLVPPGHAGHEFDAPGVFATNPRQAPGTVAWREAVPIGHTHLSQAEVHALVQEMGAQFKGNRWVWWRPLAALPCSSVHRHMVVRSCSVPPPQACASVLQVPSAANELQPLLV